MTNTSRSYNMAEESKPQSRPQSDDKALAQRVADLELQLAQSRAGTPTGSIPDHGAGIGDDVAETWSLFDQGLAAAGEHPDQEPKPTP
jgi:hypothetical protein